MTVRVIEYLSSLLPWSGRRGIDRSDAIDDFDSLDPGRQDEVARALAQLWDAFVEHFGGIEGFLTGDEVLRREYLQRIETAAERMRNAKNSDKGHYFFATAMLARYLRALCDGAGATGDQRVAGRVAALIDRGRKLLPPPPPKEEPPAAADPCSNPFYPIGAFTARASPADP